MKLGRAFLQPIEAIPGRHGGLGFGVWGQLTLYLGAMQADVKPLEVSPQAYSPKL